MGMGTFGSELFIGGLWFRTGFCQQRKTWEKRVFLGSEIKSIGKAKIFLAKALYWLRAPLLIFLFIRTVFKLIRSRYYSVHSARARTQAHTHVRAHTRTASLLDTHRPQRLCPNARGARLRKPTTTDATRAAAYTSQPQGYATLPAHKHRPQHHAPTHPPPQLTH